ncbi:alpha-amylase family protein [Lacticaseibacillus suihuaensis]
MTFDPNHMTVQLADGTWQELTHRGDHWATDGVSVTTTATTTTAAATLTGIFNSLAVAITAADQPLQRLRLTWPRKPQPGALFMGDAFERAYGELRFTPLDEAAVYPWYFVEHGPTGNRCLGVATQPNALCSWTVTNTATILWLDLRSGTRPLLLGDRQLPCCEVVSFTGPAGDPLLALTAFCTRLNQAHRPRMLPQVIGTNDWYYAYGDNNREDVIHNAKAVATLCQGLAVRPWCVVDDGWQVDHSPAYNGGPWTGGNAKFGDMAAVAAAIKTAGARPGLWFRPLLTTTAALHPHALRPDGDAFTLDISDPAVLAAVQADVRRFGDWGFELIKFDFSTVDVFAQWGPTMGLDYAQGPLQFQDQTHTTAEIVKNFYRAIREAAGAILLNGCNVVGHLAAGFIDLMRIGDDTSGRSFRRTVAMGVNSLAMRLPQHRTFYLADADCVGLTPDIDWTQNRQWLNLLANSGTPLLVSCDFSKLPAEQAAAVAQAFAQNVAQTARYAPVSVLDGRYPQVWTDGHRHDVYDWETSPLAPL